MPNDRLEETLERIAKILAGILLKDVKGGQTEKIKLLKQCDFNNSEIARMLSTTPGTVAVAAHSLKHKKKRGSKKSKGGGIEA
jgi:hypothetical protein